MARTAVLGRLTWRAATVAAVREENSTARTLVLDVPGWPGHTPGQHVDVRLTAPDGYSTQRSYSIASAPTPGRLELTVQRVDDGEVSSYLVDIAEPGDAFELRGPVGGYFTWSPANPSPVLLIGGGSGVVPLMSMIRTRAAAVDGVAPFRLVYSTRSPSSVLYGGELDGAAVPGVEIVLAYTREAPPGSARPAGRVDGALLAGQGWGPERMPLCFVCGPTGFVEAVADLLVDQGHPADRIRTERFGPTGGAS
ncbi:ferredoxin reductase [Sphaerisporangium aureirubrum]|uniref:Ferredoxin reductase n=1 Tax=Sphaerisporangium aureirubrum TaxID=1544736 RepID=A0ABW1NF66_9ACTN